MADDFWKTLILQAPNFVGFMVLAYVLVRYVIQPLMDRVDKLTEAVLRLDEAVRDWTQRHPIQ